MKIILLPGLDGTGDLFDKLILNFPKTLDTKIISYELLEGLSYLEQANEIASKVENEKLFLVGESYSGRVAYELYQILGKDVKGIVFLASFISRPSFLSRFVGFFPVSLLKPSFLIERLLYLFGFNLSGGIKVVKPVFDSLEKSNKSKLKSRLRNIARLAKPQTIINCPVVYIRPSKDRLVGSSAVNFLASICPSFSQVLVNGGHFIAQANPVACAKVISQHVTLMDQL